MILDIPNFGSSEVRYVVTDLNGTIAQDGTILSGVTERFNCIAEKGLKIYVLTADIHGNAKDLEKHLSASVAVIEGENLSKSKQDFIKKLGAQNVIAIGNGNNDHLMLKDAFIGISVIGAEGCGSKAYSNADFICRDINEALDCVLTPKRLIATLKF